MGNRLGIMYKVSTQNFPKKQYFLLYPIFVTRFFFTLYFLTNVSFREEFEMDAYKMDDSVWKIRK